MVSARDYLENAKMVVAAADEVLALPLARREGVHLAFLGNTAAPVGYACQREAVYQGVEDRVKCSFVPFSNPLSFHPLSRSRIQRDYAIKNNALVPQHTTSDGSKSGELWQLLEEIGVNPQQIVEDGRNGVRTRVVDGLLAGESMANFLAQQVLLARRDHPQTVTKEPLPRGLLDRLRGNSPMKEVLTESPFVTEMVSYIDVFDLGCSHFPDEAPTTKEFRFACSIEDAERGRVWEVPLRIPSYDYARLMCLNSQHDLQRWAPKYVPAEWGAFRPERAEADEHVKAAAAAIDLVLGARALKRENPDYTGMGPWPEEVEPER